MFCHYAMTGLNLLTGCAGYTNGARDGWSAIAFGYRFFYSFVYGQQILLVQSHSFIFITYTINEEGEVLSHIASVPDICTVFQRPWLKGRLLEHCPRFCRYFGLLH